MPNSLKNQELKYWLAFNQLAMIGPRRWQAMLAYFSDLKTAWQASPMELIKAGLEQKIVDFIIDQRSVINPDQEWEKVEKSGAKIMTILDPNYPKLLAEIYDPPPLLYYRGQLDLNNDLPLAVVGSRKMSSYGQQATQTLVADLALAKLTIISGLALGVDALAHQTALENRGKTLAVLGSGIDVIMPSTNYRLAEEIIASGGALISEFPLGTRPQKFNFPRRNRVIAGLSLGVLIVEAAAKSGALITARCALEQNREVFAVPGSIYEPNCVGTNNLIKLGARPVTDANDIFETLNLTVIKQLDKPAETDLETAAEKTLFYLITTQPIQIDKLIESSRMEISVVNATLSVLEMKGLIKNLGNQNYVKIL
ncbi:MAG: DNA protecting protein DprA [Candidatus Buchananbacteria bacterium RIFCSPLOWO2_01_FULL_46_12]|uniref:DNA protecting protein DprA n=2 Tax=Candidatus Buchananiibacteriota TaxID=1817903 RepID=A0A1G1YTD5_9BACT|nr:MAG: DNA protecting protein DprA [Candidatus Buchananbacteria bacterium RIFCSPHIGHO2_01_FULL_44_11]OGY55026.1 MAG: DNA protecting protein DprA [Candidatus Buchananbacteria bacterium RIFCSPLOWO2_01_FULL_46_12]